MLTQAEIDRLGGAQSGGPLVLVAGSDLYIYDSRSGARLGHERFRADRASGFYEMTAISHIGPAIAYLAQIKADGDARWKERLASLQAHVAEVRSLNLRATDNWLDRLDQPAWRTRKAEIRNMVDYACARTLDYIGAPYAEDRPSLGQPQMAPADLQYYVQRVWGPLFYRQLVADRVFSNIPTIYLPDRPALPGDPGVTSADAIDQFMIRLKHSLRDAREIFPTRWHSGWCRNWPTRNGTRPWSKSPA